MKKIVIILAAVLFQAYSHSGNFVVSEPFIVSGGEAGCAFFTKNQEGKPVLCWTE